MKKLYAVIQKLTIVLLFIILLIFALSEARSLLYPIVLAILFSYLLFPVANWLEKKGAPRILANFVVIIFSLALMGVIVYILYSQVGLLVQKLPELEQQAKENVNHISESISSTVGVSTAEFKVWVNERINYFLTNSGLFANTIFPSTAGTITALGLMPVYVFLFLFYRDKFYDFFFMIWPESRHAKAKEVITEISHVTKRYMGGVFTVVLILCFINSLGLMLIGVQFALLLGILSAFCNFIPYFGTLIGAVFPLLMAIFTGESPNQVVSVIIMFILIQFTENNILTPNITGGSVQINPMVTIISIIIGGMIWGIPGMFVVVPVMGMLKIVLENNPTTKPLAFLMGPNGTEKHSLTFNKIKKFFTISKK